MDEIFRPGEARDGELGEGRGGTEAMVCVVLVFFPLAGKRETEDHKYFLKLYRASLRC